MLKNYRKYKSDVSGYLLHAQAYCMRLVLCLMLFSTSLFSLANEEVDTSSLATKRYVEDYFYCTNNTCDAGSVSIANQIAAKYNYTLNHLLRVAADKLCNYPNQQCTQQEYTLSTSAMLNAQQVNYAFKRLYPQEVELVLGGDKPYVNYVYHSNILQLHDDHLLADVPFASDDTLTRYAAEYVKSESSIKLYNSTHKVDLLENEASYFGLSNLAYSDNVTISFKYVGGSLDDDSAASSLYVQYGDYLVKFVRKLNLVHIYVAHHLHTINPTVINSASNFFNLSGKYISVHIAKSSTSTNLLAGYSIGDADHQLLNAGEPDHKLLDDHDSPKYLFSSPVVDLQFIAHGGQHKIADIQVCKGVQSPCNLNFGE